MIQKKYDFISRKEVMAQKLLEKLKEEFKDKPSSIDTTIVDNLSITKSKNYNELIQKLLYLLNDPTNANKEKLIESIMKKLKEENKDSKVELEKIEFMLSRLQKIILLKNEDFINEKEKHIFNSPLLQNFEIQSIVWQSLFILVTLENAKDFPLAVMLDDFYKCKQDTNLTLNTFSWMEYMNVDLDLLNENALNDKIDNNYYYKCKNFKKTKHFFYSNHLIKECKFCKKKGEKPKKLKKCRKFMKIYKERKVQKLIVNNFSRHSVKGSLKDENIISFRIMFLFKHCCLLGLYIIDKDIFEKLFGLEDYLLPKHKNKNRSTLEYLYFIIEKEIDYLKRVYRLNSRPYDSIRIVFNNLRNIIETLGVDWESNNEGKGNFKPSKDQEKSEKDKKINYFKKIIHGKYQEPNELLFDKIRESMKNQELNEFSIDNKHKKLFDIMDQLDNHNQISKTAESMKNLDLNKSQQLSTEFTNLYIESLDYFDSFDMTNIKETLIVKEISGNENYKFLKFYFKNEFLQKNCIYKYYEDILSFAKILENNLEIKYLNQKYLDETFVDYMKKKGTNLEFNQLKSNQNSQFSIVDEFNEKEIKKIIESYEDFAFCLNSLINEGEQPFNANILEYLEKGDCNLFQNLIRTPKKLENKKVSPQQEFKKENLISQNNLDDAKSISSKEINENESISSSNIKENKKSNIKSDSDSKNENKLSEDSISESEPTMNSEEESVQTNNDSISESLNSNPEDSEDEILKLSEKNDFQIEEQTKIQTPKKLIFSKKTIKQLLENDKLMLKNLMITSKNSQSSITMIICRFLGELQSNLIRHFNVDHVEEKQKSKSQSKISIPQKLDYYETKNIFGADKKKDILNIKKRLLERAYESTGGYHFQSEEQLLMDINQYMFDEVIANLPLLETNLIDDFNYYNHQINYITQKHLNKIRKNIDGKNLSQKQLKEVVSNLQKNKEISQDLYYRFFQFLSSWDSKEEKFSKDHFDKIIGIDGKNEKNDKKLKKIFSKKIHSFKYIVHIFEILELEVFDHFTTEFVNFNKDQLANEWRETLNDIEERQKKLIIDGLKRILLRFHLIKDFKDKTTMELIEIFEDFFIPQEMYENTIKLEQYRKNKKNLEKNSLEFDEENDDIDLLSDNENDIDLCKSDNEEQDMDLDALNISIERLEKEKENMKIEAKKVLRILEIIEIKFGSIYTILKYLIKKQK